MPEIQKKQNVHEVFKSPSGLGTPRVYLVTQLSNASPALKFKVRKKKQYLHNGAENKNN